MKAWLPLLSMVFLLSGCQTPYQADAWYEDGGYSERQVGPGQWVVTFTGNENTSVERTRDFSYLRCAEICQNEGFDFVTFEQSHQLIDQFEEETSEVEVDEDGDEEEVSVSFYTVRSPRTIQEIECRHANPDQRRDTFEVTFLMTSIGSKYDL